MRTIKLVFVGQHY